MRFAGTQLTNFIDPTNFDAIGKSSIVGNSILNQADMKGRGLVDMTDIKAAASIKAAGYGADATRAQGAAQGQASMFSGLGNMASGIVGGLANMGGSVDNNYGLPSSATAPTQTGVNHFSLDSMMEDFQKPGFSWPRP